MDPRYKALEAALTNARTSAGLTQADVAGRLGKPQSFVSKYGNGERRLDLVELLDVCAVLGASPASILASSQVGGDELRLFARWAINEKILTDLVDQNGSLRGMLFGYVAEHKFKELYLSAPYLIDLGKDRDHDRKRKGDRNVEYRGRRIRIEVKSLQTKTVRDLGGDRWTGASQVDGSDKRKITFPNGTRLETTLLLRGEFDILAVNCYAYGNRWRYAFARNDDLPPSIYQDYSPEIQRQLIASMVDVPWPPKPPFTADLRAVLERTIKEPSAREEVVAAGTAVTSKLTVEKVIRVRRKS